PGTVHYGSRFRNNSADQANLFNEFFFNQFSEQSDYDIDIKYQEDSFIDLNISRDDVFDILKSINPSKAAGPDSIHGKVLKNCARSLAYPLSILFNLSFSIGCIPQDWKLALVVPVFKKGDKSSVENYRPISLTSLIMKVFERCIRSALFAACSDLIDPRQHGFVNGRSCTTQMVPFTDNLALALNESSRVDIIYFDFAKAFDSVSHDLILFKLKNIYRVDGVMLKFIKSYLEGRLQQVVIGGEKSLTMPVKSGVPQGSILGPLLFVLFINDMFSCVSEGTNIALYADDTKIWREIKSFYDHHIIQTDIKKLYDWSIRNRMVFHPKKCKALSVTLQRNVLDNLPFNTFFYELSGKDIDFVQSWESHTDLGIEMKTNLTWSTHCKALVSKASSRLGLLKRTCHFATDKKQKRSFYLALVRAIFEHCSVVWSPQYSTIIEQFAAIQKRAVKWINGEPFASYNDEVFAMKQRELNILPIMLKFIYNDLIFFYKIVNSIVPVNLPDYITVFEPEGTQYTRRNAQI
ncbi:MAG: reverse transcriptase family protein, partial [Cytophagales bacterium]|nr:reverse transcriptase family protein [Cytophagales bacterium]